MRSLLLVDDSPISRKILRKLLPSEGYEIREASSGLECLAEHHRQPADLIFLDLTMPGMDGFETLARLKALDPKVKVVVVTADIQTTSQSRCLELGALQVICKPPKAEVLGQALERLDP